MKINSNKLKGRIIAQNGLIEEQKVCLDLQNPIIKNRLSTIIGNNYDKCTKVNGKHKCDIQSKNKILKCQIKKYKKNMFQQLDKNNISVLVNKIPELKDCEQILRGFCEYPLLPNKTHVDRSKTIKKMSTEFYTDEELKYFIKTLNDNRRKILNFVFFGSNIEMQPTYLVGVEYVKNKRTKIIAFEIKKIIEYLEKLEFKISLKKTTILLGDERIISFQRKGGDSNRKSSNKFQTKIILSKLVKYVDNAIFYY
tara:strand:- start:20118 stop:20876 length:759 start_codon:yes stop_codon:yes gene_type:complete